MVKKIGKEKKHKNWHFCCPRMIADIPLLSKEISTAIPIDYKKWKEYRIQKTREIGEKLVKIDPNFVNSTFEQWESFIREIFSKDNQRTQMVVLLSISILHFFQRDIDIIRQFNQKLLTLLQSNKNDVSRAAAQVIHWISEENSEGSQLFTLPVNMGSRYPFLWLCLYVT